MRYALVALAILTGCGTKAPPTPKDSSMAGMPGMPMPGGTTGADSGGKPGLPTTVTFSKDQVDHGGVRWIPATVGQVAPRATVPGEILPDEDRAVRLGAPASGRIVAVSVRSGDQVSSGQVLVRLQSPEAGLAQAEGAKAAAEVTSRRAQAAYATSARDRAERLLALKSIPRQDYERAVADAEEASAGLAQAEAEQRRAAQVIAQLGVTSVAGEMAIRSPIAGVVLSRMAVPGSVVEAGAPLVAVFDAGTLWLAIDAPEQLASLFHRDGVLRFAVPAFPSDTFTARVDAIGAGLEPATRTLSVRGRIANRDGRLKPAMIATVTVEGARSAMAVVVPEAAVQVLDGKTYVFVASPDPQGGARFTRREVVVGSHERGSAAILSGISSGDVIVTEGAFAVKAEFLKGSMPKMEM
ncbi:MAG: efflux RND transporter periplasmic adaptor subunit [Gemmatimonadales bacterium]